MPTKNDTRTLKTFALASFLNDLGADAIKPFWPLFVTSVLGAPASILGLLDGIGEVVSYGSRFPAGWLSDKFRRRKPLVWIGYLLAGLGRLGYAVTSVVGWLFPFKIMDRLGKLRDPPRDALLADITKKEERGKAFGYLTAADNFGATLGPIFGLILFLMFGFRNMFAIAAIPSLIGAAAIYFFVAEKKPKPFVMRHNNFSKDFKKLAILSAIFGLSWISLSFMTLHAVSVEKLPVYITPALFVVMSLVSVFSSALAGKLSDNIGRKNTMLISFGLYTLVALGFLSTHLLGLQGASAIIAAFGLFGLYGLHYGAMTAVQPAYIADLVPSERRASASGIFQAIFGFAALGASVIAGILWDVISPAASFGYGTVISLIAMIVFAFAIKK